MNIDSKDATSFSAFSQEVKDEFGGAGARSLLSGERFSEIQRRAHYYECKQHDKKFWDFDGRPVSLRTTQPFLGMEQATWVPMNMRRPSFPVRLGRVIVDSFTNLLFGENRFPTFTVEGDADTEDWIQAVSRAGKLPAKMIQARTYGGACGTVGMSWCFEAGHPRFEVHRAQNLFVHRWVDRVALEPEWVTEVYLHSRLKWDGKGFNNVWYWYRRDWTPDADVMFEDVLYDPKAIDIQWVVDRDKTTFHGDGQCHFEWIQNLPHDDIDGLPDYDGLYENFDEADLIMSILTRGARANLDPTLVMKMDRAEWDARSVQKGSDQSLFVGHEGDAQYLELNGGSIEQGLKLVEAHRRQLLEAAQCVIPDPSTIAAQGISSVAIKAMFAPMLAKTDVLREQYGSAATRMLRKMERCARDATTVPIEMEVHDPATGLATSVAVLHQVVLPPKVEDVPEIEPITGLPTGKMVPQQVPRVLGPGGEIDLEWPPFFPPTPQDQAQITTSLSTATGGKAFLSQETAANTAARAFGVDPTLEWEKVKEENQAAAQAQASMVDPIGAPVSDPNQQPPGADPNAGAATLDPLAGLPPVGLDMPDPDDQVPHTIDMTGG